MFTDQQNAAWNQNTSGVQPITAFTAQTATTATSAVLDCVVTRSTAVLQVNTVGSPTAGVVALQGSLDSVGWFALASTANIVAAGTTATVSTATPFRYLRAQITTAIAGTGASATALVGASG
jgi:hypothetical protein